MARVYKNFSRAGMSMNYLRLSFFTLFLIFSGGWLFFALSVIYHLRQYSLPGWTAPRFVVPVFVGVAVLLFSTALYFLFSIPYSAFTG